MSDVWRRKIDFALHTRTTQRGTKVGEDRRLDGASADAIVSMLFVSVVRSGRATIGNQRRPHEA